MRNNTFTINELRENRAKAWESAKAFLDSHRTENGTLSAEDNAIYEKMESAFEPEFAGKLNFYVSAVDELLKLPEDNPTIGLLICREMNRTEVQWTFRNIQTPMGVATYSNIQVEEIKEMLPSTEQICELVDRAQEEFEAAHKEEEQ